MDLVDNENGNGTWKAATFGFIKEADIESGTITLVSTCGRREISSGVFEYGDADQGKSTRTDPTLEDTNGDGIIDGYADINLNGSLDAGETDAVVGFRTKEGVCLVTSDEVIFPSHRYEIDAIHRDIIEDIEFEYYFGSENAPASVSISPPIFDMETSSDDEKITLRMTLTKAESEFDLVVNENRTRFSRKVSGGGSKKAVSSFFKQSTADTLPRYSDNKTDPVYDYAVDEALITRISTPATTEQAIQLILDGSLYPYYLQAAKKWHLTPEIIATIQLHEMKNCTASYVHPVGQDLGWDSVNGSSVGLGAVEIHNCIILCNERLGEKARNLRGLWVHELASNEQGFDYETGFPLKLKELSKIGLDNSALVRLHHETDSLYAPVSALDQDRLQNGPSISRYSVYPISCSYAYLREDDDFRHGFFVRLGLVNDVATNIEFTAQQIRKLCSAYERFMPSKRDIKCGVSYEGDLRKKLNDAANSWPIYQANEIPLNAPVISVALKGDDYEKYIRTMRMLNLVHMAYKTSGKEYAVNHYASIPYLDKYIDYINGDDLINAYMEVVMSWNGSGVYE